MATQDRPDDHRARRKDREASVVGSLSDMGVADLVQTLEMGRKSGVLHLKARTGARGTCWLRGGRVVDCELTGAPAGEEAFYRILRWREGGFAIEFKPVEREERIQLPTQALLLQGMRRIDDWGRLVEQLPPLDRRLEVDVARLGERLAKVPDDANALLRLFDGRRTLAQVIEASPRDDLATADAVARLVAEGILKETPAGAASPAAEAPGPVATAPALPPEPGGVDWFAGPVGPEAAAAPVASWVLAPEPAPESRSASPDGGGWLEPPLAAPEAAPAAVPAAPPRPAPRFSIPVPPPGSLPPPPSVAETLARYQVVPRPRRPGVPESGPSGTLATVEPTPAQPTPAQPAPQPEPVIPVPAPPAPSQPVVPSPEPLAPPPQPVVPVPEPPAPAPRPTPPAPEAPVPSPQARPAAADPALAGPGERAGAPAAASGPAEPETTPSELARRLSGKPAARRLDPGSLPVHLEAERLPREQQPAPSRRSAAPYLALGAIVLAAIVGGTTLTRRPVLHASPPAEAAAAAPTRGEPAGDGAAVSTVEQPASAHAKGDPPSPAAAAAPVPAAPVAAVESLAPATQPPAEASQPPAAASTRPAPAAKVAPPAPAPAARAAVTAAAVERADPSRPPAAPAASGEIDARKLLAGADRKYAAGRYAEAIADYRRAIAQRSTPAAHVSLARALYDAHRSAEAMKELDGVISENPGDASAWLLRGDIHQGEGRPAEARDAYQRFLELQPHGEQARTVRMILGREQQ